MTNQGLTNQGLTNQGLTNRGLTNQGLTNRGLTNRGLTNRGGAVIMVLYNPVSSRPSPQVKFIIKGTKTIKHNLQMFRLVN